MPITLSNNQILSIIGGTITVGLLPAVLWAMGTSADVANLEVEKEYIEEDFSEMKDNIKETNSMVQQNRESIIKLENDTKHIRKQNEEISKDIKKMMMQMEHNNE